MRRRPPAGARRRRRPLSRSTLPHIAASAVPAVTSTVAPAPPIAWVAAARATGAGSPLEPPPRAPPGPDPCHSPGELLTGAAPARTAGAGSAPWHRERHRHSVAPPRPPRPRPRSPPSTSGGRKGRWLERSGARGGGPSRFEHEERADLRLSGGREREIGVRVWLWVYEL